MKHGTTGIELEVTLSFHNDGALSGLHSIATVGGLELPEQLQRDLYAWLSERKQFDAIVDECWANAEPEAGDEAHAPAAE